MTTNFSVSDAAIEQYVKDGGIEVTRYRRNGTAVGQAIAQSGGRVYPNLAPVPTRIPVTHGQGIIGSQSESTKASSTTAPQSARDMTPVNLLIEAHTEWEQTTDQAMEAELHGVASADAWGARLAASKSPAIFSGFDSEFLASVLTGPTDVEWTGNGIEALDTALAIYDETAYNGDAMIVTRRGARAMGLAQNADNMLQFPGGVDGIPFDGPILRTDATAADIGTANLLAVIGPFATCAYGFSGQTDIQLYDQLEETEGGARQQLLTWLVKRYLGAVSSDTSVVPATAWVTITDDTP